MNDAVSHAVLQLLLDVTDTADPHVNRSLSAYLSLLPLTDDDRRGYLVDVVAVFERLGKERPDVVLPFLGRLLSEAQERDA
ncbi:MAG: hypothetical protein JWP11_1507 [Frankiales bacterium]|nr:hypothetical protein [Frankiales bacterium]